MGLREDILKGNEWMREILTQRKDPKLGECIAVGEMLKSDFDFDNAKYDVTILGHERKRYLAHDRSISEAIEYARGEYEKEFGSGALEGVGYYVIIWPSEGISYKVRQEYLEKYVGQSSA